MPFIHILRRAYIDDHVQESYSKSHAIDLRAIVKSMGFRHFYMAEKILSVPVCWGMQSSKSSILILIFSQKYKSVHVESCLWTHRMELSVLMVKSIDPIFLGIPYLQ